MSFEDQIERQMREAGHVALFLDFDGTLAPIVPRPGDAAMPEATYQALANLAARPNYTVAFVSGRSAADLRQRAAIPNAVYAGNHGLEIEGRGLRFETREDPLLRETVEALRLGLAWSPESEIEDKVLSASIHFRRVPPADWPRVQAVVRATVPPALNLRGGKMVFELRPAVPWHKGSAVLWIIEQLRLAGACHVYIGDDLTDEDAFAVLPEGITVHVGPGETLAKYRLGGVEEVGQLLERLAHG